MFIATLPSIVVHSKSDAQQWFSSISDSDSRSPDIYGYYDMEAYKLTIRKTICKPLRSTRIKFSSQSGSNEDSNLFQVTTHDSIFVEYPRGEPSLRPRHERYTPPLPYRPHFPSHIHNVRNTITHNDSNTNNFNTMTDDTLTSLDSSDKSLLTISPSEQKCKRSSSSTCRRFASTRAVLLTKTKFESS